MTIDTLSETVNPFYIIDMLAADRNIDPALRNTLAREHGKQLSRRFEVETPSAFAPLNLGRIAREISEIDATAAYIKRLEAFEEASAEHISEEQRDEFYRDQRDDFDRDDRREQDI